MTSHDIPLNLAPARNKSLIWHSRGEAGSR